MANILDYLKWRGDLPFSRDPFNDVDALVFSRLSYIPFDGVVSEHFQTEIPLFLAIHKLFRTPNLSERLLVPQDRELLSLLLRSERFREARLCGYRNKWDLEDQKQFAALVYTFLDDQRFLCFRGTDNTLVGWKEDFNMSFMTPVPSQVEAVRYTNEAAKELTGSLRLGGHSKGGNLAVFAASFCEREIQKRIEVIYDNDGPGLDSCTFLRSGYQAIQGRIHAFVPQSSVIGMLLEHEESYTIVRSSQKGLMQHDLYSWEIEGKQFLCLNIMTKQSEFVEKTLKRWLISKTPEEREQFMDTLYAILQQTNAQTVTELTANWYRSARIVLRTLNSMDPGTKRMLADTLRALGGALKDTLPLLLPLSSAKAEEPAFITVKTGKSER